MTSGANGPFRSGDVVRSTYTIEDSLGRGAYGHVYRARHRFLGLQALKAIDLGPDSKTNPSAALDEAVILASLFHPNIVRVFDADLFEKDGETIPFITMEFMPGGTLGQFMNRSIRLGIPESLDFTMQLLRGLQAAHTNEPSVLHRDITPNNVLLDASLSGLRLSDFGLARHVDPDLRILRAAGTIRYQPPESTWGYATEASDLYAVALIAYEMITGKAAFPLPPNAALTTSASITRAFRASRERMPDPPSKFRSGVPADIDFLLRTALTPDPKLRFRSAEEFLDAVSAVTLVD